MASPRKIKAQVTEIRYYKNGITLFHLKTAIDCKFKPGQFLHLAIDPYDPSFNWPESRVFSIANAPANGHDLEILISPKGAFTQRIIRELKIGEFVWVKLPFGIFNFDAAENSRVIMIAGGTGISPFLSFLRSQLLKPLSFHSLTLYYGIRDPELIIFNDLLVECARKIRGFSYHLYCEQGISYPDHQFHHGILPVGEIVNTTSLMTDQVYYLSGPTAMILAFEKALTLSGIPENKIFFDKWE